MVAEWLFHLIELTTWFIKIRPLFDIVHLHTCSLGTGMSVCVCVFMKYTRLNPAINEYVYPSEKCQSTGEIYIYQFQLEFKKKAVPSISGQ